MRALPIALLTAVGLVLAGCGSGGAATSAQPSANPSAAQPVTDKPGGEVVLIAHDSFEFPDALVADFEATTGYKLKITKSGDGGQLANKLVLTKDAPLADAFFGVDNSFITALVSGGAVAAYRSATLPADPALEADAAGSATPIDHGYVCVNVDNSWYAKKKQAPPTSLDDLVNPEFAGQAVAIDPTASSPGAAFLFATVAAKGEAGFQDYWRKLLANRAKVDQGWTDAYYTDFSGAGEGGKFPITVSYNTSPAYTVPKGSDATTTSALLDTCTRQVEYAGVLAGAANAKGAQALVDYLAGRKFQDTIAEAMYMYPADAKAAVPKEWTKWAPIPTKTLDLDPEVLAASRTTWLDAWSQIAG